jgi:hypothetical protein
MFVMVFPYVGGGSIASTAWCGSRGSAAEASAEPVTLAASPNSQGPRCVAAPGTQQPGVTEPVEPLDLHLGAVVAPIQLPLTRAWFVFDLEA